MSRTLHLVQSSNSRIDRCLTPEISQLGPVRKHRPVLFVVHSFVVHRWGFGLFGVSSTRRPIARRECPRLS